MRSVKLFFGFSCTLLTMEDFTGDTPVINTGSCLTIPCLFSISYASLIFGSFGIDNVHRYNKSITFACTFSDVLFPKYLNRKTKIKQDTPVQFSHKLDNDKALILNYIGVSGLQTSLEISIKIYTSKFDIQGRN